MRSLLLSLAFPLAAGAQIMADPPRPLPCPVPPCERGRPCPMRPCGIVNEQVVRQSSDVRVELVDRVLRYEITEVFVNRGGRVGEADYMFPLPKGAALQDLKLSINGEMIAGETMSSDRARQIYEEIVRQRRDPALLEWMGYGLLRARIFPIAPGEEKKVVVRFQQVAPREGDALRIDYFRGLSNNTRTGQSEGKTTFTLTYPDDARYGVAYSPTHSLDNEHSSGTRRAVIKNAAGEVTLLLPVRASNTPAITLLANAPGNEDGFALITLSPPATARNVRSAVPRDVTFVVDVSGSMNGRKIEQAREAGKQLLHSLSPNDRFHLIDFSSEVHNFRDGWTVASRENIRAAERYFDGLDAEGGTNIAGALDAALALPVQSGRLPLVLFVTDGQPTIGETNGSVIGSNVASHRGERRLFTFGVGADLNISLIEQLAIEGRGTASFVRPDESVERAVSIVASRLTNPLVTGVRVRADGITLRKMHPSGAVDIFAGEDLVVLARYTGDGNATLRFDGQTVNGPVSWTQRVNFPERSRENPFVARLWATQRVGYLSAEKRKHGGASREIDDEIRQLGERYGIPTEFSSYLVLEPGMQAAALQRRALNSNLQLQAQVVTGATSNGSLSPPPPPPPSVVAPESFDAAKIASAMRDVRSTVVADSISAAVRPGTMKRSGNLVFIYKDSVWTDTRPASGPVLRIKPYSAAYFKLIDLYPDLREPLSLADRIKVSGRKMSIEVSPAGTDQLTDRDLQQLKERW